jgi:hypothetical protein
MLPHYTSNGNQQLIDWRELDRRILAGLDIRAEYEALGARIVGRRESASGWLACRAFGREDRNPSAAINVGDGPARGKYVDHGGGDLHNSYSLWDVAARYGNFLGWRDARDHYARKAGIDLPHPPRGVWRREAGNGGVLASRPDREHRPETRTDAELKNRFSLVEATPREVADAASRLKLPEFILSTLPLYAGLVNGRRRAPLFPEMSSGNGTIIGLYESDLPDSKPVTGKRGLCLHPNFYTNSGPIFITRVHRPTLALVSLGLRAVGWTIKADAVALLTHILLDDYVAFSAHVAAGWPIVVVGHNSTYSRRGRRNDEEYSQLARDLATSLGRDILLTFPNIDLPNCLGFTDCWDWFCDLWPPLHCTEAEARDGRAKLNGGMTFEACGAMFAQELLASAITITPRLGRRANFSYADKGYKRNSRAEPPPPPAPSPAVPPSSASRKRTAAAGQRPCPARGMPLLQALDDPYQGAAMQVPCKRWTCVACFKWQQGKWTKHLCDGEAGAICTVPAGKRIVRREEPIWLWEGGQDSCKRMVDRIRRAGGEYAAVCTAGDRVVIATTAAVRDFRQVAPQEAAAAVAAAIAEIPYRPTREGESRRPVNTSRGWKLPKKEPSYRLKEMARNTTPGELIDRGAKLGLNITGQQTPELPWMGEWEFPGGWTSQDIDESFSRLAKPSPPPPSTADSEELI